jgi:DNA-binding YbaB/EbfC family protein
MPSDENEDDVTAEHEHDDEVDNHDEDGSEQAELSGLLAQLEAVTEDLEEAAEEVADIIVEGTSAGGSVVVQLTGALEAVGVRIDPSLVDPTDVAMLEDAVLAALRDGLAQVVELQEEFAEEIEDDEIDLSALLGKLGGLANFGALGLPDLGNLAGNPEDLIAGLTGALGSLSGGFPGGGLPGGLSDLMAGLGFPPGATGVEDHEDENEEDDEDDEHGPPGS